VSLRRAAPLLLLAAVAGAVVPHEEIYYGSTLAAFLLQPASARTAAIGQAFTAVADDPTAVAINPGGLTRVTHPAFAAMYDRLDTDIGMSDLAGSLPLGPGVAGLSVAFLSFGSYDQRDINGLVTGTDAPTEVAVDAGFAVSHPDWMGIPGSSGVTIEMVKEAWGGPVGAATFGSVIPACDGLSLGWSAQHIGVPRHGTTLPAMLNLGAAYVHPAFLHLTTDAIYPVTTQRLIVAVGAEAVPDPRLALRAGYRWSLGNGSLTGLTGLSAGIGIRLLRFAVDYAIRPFGDLAISQTLSLSYDLAPTPGASPAPPETPAAAPLPAMANPPSAAPLAPPGATSATTEQGSP